MKYSLILKPNERPEIEQLFPSLAIPELRTRMCTLVSPKLPPDPISPPACAAPAIVVNPSSSTSPNLSTLFVNPFEDAQYRLTPPPSKIGSLRSHLPT